MTIADAAGRYKDMPYRSVFLFSAAIWTTVAVAIMAWDWNDRQAFLTANALSSARANFEKDVAFRSWAAKHGGVYVPITAETSPNPLLKLPERDISTPSGRELTLMNPAYMTRQIYEVSRSNPNAPQGHITSLKPIRAENAPDPWEKKSLEAFEKGAAEYSEFQVVDGKSLFRFMRPLSVEKPCLTCHADQGYREGDIRGGISVSIPMTALVESTKRSSFQHLLVITMGWLLGVAGLWFGLSRIGAASQALKAKRNDLRAIFEASPVGMLLVDESLHIIRTNQAARKIFCRPADPEENITCGEMLGCRNLSDCPAGCGFAPGCATCGIMTAVRSTFRAGENIPYGESLLSVERAGEAVELWVYFGTTLIMQNGVNHVLLSLEDITGLKQTEQALREKTDFIENLLHNSTTPTFVIDTDHRVLIWNRAVEELTGVKAQDMVGTSEQWRPFYQTERPCLADIALDGSYRESAGLYVSLSPSRLIPDGLHAEADFCINSRKCHLIFSAAPIRDRDGKVIAAIETLEDITERISLETQLFHAQKMESVGALAGGIAHDFNNVLTVISGYAALLQLTTRKDEKQQHIANEIMASVERAADMTRSLLAFSGKHEMKLQYDDLNQILSAISKSLTRLIREDITLTISPAPGQLTVFVDRVQIEQILINLIVNARDALMSGGTITVSSEPVDLDSARVEGNAVIPPGRYACLCVADNGTGMDAETVGRIFEPFFTTKEKGKGTGLGLAIAHGIITKHNGLISVTSIPGSGTEFRVYLPPYEGQEALKRVAAPPSINHHGTETVLIVEDDDAIMKLHREVMGRYGYKVLEARDGVEALEVFNAHRDEIQIAIVDVIMPRMNGRELVEQIREQRATLPIVMISGYTDEIVDREAIDRLKVVFLQKPVKPLELLATIRSSL